MVRDLIRIFQGLLLVLLLASAGAAWADPPSRVGRLSVIDGELAMRREDSRQWESASVNWPVTGGDSLATERRSRAEIRVGSSVLRLDENTTVQVRRLDDERIRVRLEEGSVALRVRSSDREDAIEVETRDGLAVTTQPGRYRIDQFDRDTIVTTYRGHIDFRTQDRHVGISDDRRAEISSDGRLDVSWSAPDSDDFSDWAQTRDERDDRYARPRHVSPEMTGYEDLYEYGDWRDSDDYGTVWYPRAVSSDWAPYRYGRWVNVAPWGWTWVDDAPWGFAPFHYGRWVAIRGRWAWVPGRYEPRPVYAPALVAWIGTPGVSVSLFSSGSRNAGWYPLAPREVYVPYYRYSPTYVRRVNVTHVTNVTEITRVVQAPERARHVYRDQRFAVTPASERFVQAPRVVNLDPERRHEERRAEWERRRERGQDPRRADDRDRREAVRVQEGVRVQEAAPGGAIVSPAVRQRLEREQNDPIRVQREQAQQGQQERREFEQQQRERRIQEQEDRRRPAEQREQADPIRMQREQAQQQREDARRAEFEQRQRERQQQQQEQEERRRAVQQREQADSMRVQREQAQQQREDARRAEFEQRQRERQQQQQEQEERRRAVQQREQPDPIRMQREQARQERAEAEQRQRERAAAQQERREAPQQHQGRAEEERQRRRQNNPFENRPDSGN